MSNTEKELKACPWCNGPAEEPTAFTGWKVTRCQKGSDCAGGLCYLPIAAWNQRPASPLAEENKRLREAVLWALGERGDFPRREDEQGAYWWRTELRRRALADTVAQAEPIGEREGE